MRAALLALTLAACASEPVRPEPSQGPRSGGSGIARREGREVPFVDTHDHFAHATDAVDARRGNGYYRRRGAAQEIALTFDCAWVPEARGREVLDALRELGVRATFFIAGPFVFQSVPAGEGTPPNAATRALVRRIVEEGHEVANHTHTHPHASARVGWERELSELSRGWTAATRAAFPEGPPASAAMTRLWRAPYGEYDDRALTEAALAGYPLHVGWNVDLLDSVGLPDCKDVPATQACLTPERQTRHVLAFARKHADLDAVVVLAHLGAPYGWGRDPKGLRALVTTLRAEGRSFARLSEIVVAPRATP